MNDVNKALSKALQYNHRQKELYAVCPIPADKLESIKIQIVTDYGRSKWLSIDAAEFRAIEDVLVGDSE